MKQQIITYLFTFFIASIVIISCTMHYETQKVNFVVKNSSAAQIKEGKRLTILMCSPCHYDPFTKKLTGIQMADVPKFVGKIYAKNITQHPTKGIGNYTDGELAYLIRTGIAKNGQLMPYMQRPNLADKDLESIISYLKSDDEMVKASETEIPETRYTPMGKMGITKFSPPLPYPDKEITKPEASDKIAYGKYLVDNLSCYDCHSASFTSINKIEPERSKGYMGGGNKLMDMSGKQVLTPNLTFHETGIGNWSEEDFIKAIKMGINKDNLPITFPMPIYSELSNDEISAIYSYLKSIPPIKNSISKK